MDISEELLYAIRNEFEEAFENNEIIQECFKKVADGTATYEEAYMFSNNVGDMLAEAYRNNIKEDKLPNGTLYYNICQKTLRPTLEENYSRVAEFTADVQTALNRALGMGLQGIIPELDNSMIVNLVDKITEGSSFEEIAWLLGKPVTTFIDMTVDRTLKANCDFQARSGLNPQLIRKAESSKALCKWCKNLAGVYDYNNAPEDIYKRHENCRCTTEYVGNGIRQNVWSKKILK